MLPRTGCPARTGAHARLIADKGSAPAHTHARTLHVGQTEQKRTRSTLARESSRDYVGTPEAPGAKSLEEMGCQPLANLLVGGAAPVDVVKRLPAVGFGLAVRQESGRVDIRVCAAFVDDALRDAGHVDLGDGVGRS